jgi:hypothetical protein
MPGDGGHSTAHGVYSQEEYQRRGKMGENAVD